jgi:hypothetical protein
MSELGVIAGGTLHAVIHSPGFKERHPGTSLRARGERWKAVPSMLCEEGRGMTRRVEPWMERPGTAFPAGTRRACARHARGRAPRPAAHPLVGPKTAILSQR